MSQRTGTAISLVRWARPARIVGIAAVATGIGLAAWPGGYTNPAYGVVLDHITARQAGIAWIVVGVAAAAHTRAWSVALLGSAIIGWGLGLGVAAWLYQTGSPFGWLWLVALGLTVLRNLEVEPLGA